MKKSLSLIAVFVVIGFASNPTQAANHYVSGMAGVSWMNNITPSESYQASSGNQAANFDLKSGINALGAVGCDYGNYRLEAEIGYQQNKLRSGVDSIDGVVQYYPLEGSRYEMRGDVSVLSLMGNGYYDFHLGSGIDFYATAGIGVAQVSFKDMNSVHNYDPVYDVLYDNPNPGYNDHATTLAYQVGAGLAFPVTHNIKLDLRYRYFATTDFSYGNDWFGTAGKTDITTNVVSHSALIGLRVGF